MPHDLQPIRGVTKNYERRTLGPGAGMHKSTNGSREFTFKFSGAFLSELENGGAYVPNVQIPAGHVVVQSSLIVHEAFDVTGDTVIGAGSDTLTLTQVSLESVGVSAPTSAGQLQDGEYVTSAVGLGVVSTSTGVDSTIGKAELVIITRAV